MPKFVLECTFDLPENGHDAADAVALTKEPWRTLLKSLEAAGINYHDRAETVDAGPKPSPAKARRGRPPKAFVQQPLATQAVAAE